jgi:hypothetical protein
MLRNQVGSMTVVSSFTPWPWPSRFSKEETTEVRIPPGDVSFEGNNDDNGVERLITYPPTDGRRPCKRLQ